MTLTRCRIRDVDTYVFDVDGAFHFAHCEMAREQVSPVDLGER